MRSAGCLVNRAAAVVTTKLRYSSDRQSGANTGTMKRLTAGLLAFGAGLGCSLATADDGAGLPRFASRDFFDTLQRFDEGPADIGADGRPRPGLAAEVNTAVPAKFADASVQSAPSPASWPKTLPEAKAEANIDLAAHWPEVDVNLAKARCADILRSLDAVTMPEPPMRHGACGAPAPVRLISIGRKPEVALSPPPLVTCDMVQALHTWITKDVQPAAKRTLGTQVVKLELMSDYSCRNAYGNRHGRLSEHARANAIDIRGFMTTKGEMTAFLEDWGPTGREIREIAAKAAREKLEAARLATKPAAATPAPAATAAASPSAGTSGGEALAAAAGLTRATIAEGLARIPSVPMSSKGEAAVAAGFSHLGGPKTSASAEPVPPNVNGRAAFLRQVHDSACKTFGTVLGPEANRAHRNHLHVDMADRSTGVYCE